MYIWKECDKKIWIIDFMVFEFFMHFLVVLVFLIHKVTFQNYFL